MFKRGMSANLAAAVFLGLAAATYECEGSYRGFGRRLSRFMKEAPTSKRAKEKAKRKKNHRNRK